MIFDKIKEIIAEQLGVEEDAVKMETHLMKDLEADSLDAVEIINAWNAEIPCSDFFLSTRDFRPVFNRRNCTAFVLTVK